MSNEHGHVVARACENERKKMMRRICQHSTAQDLRRQQVLGLHGEQTILVSPISRAFNKLEYPIFDNAFVGESNVFREFGVGNLHLVGLAFIFDLVYLLTYITMPFSLIVPWCTGVTSKTATSVGVMNLIPHLDLFVIGISRLTVTSKLISTSDPNKKLITIKLDHRISHVHYYDVSLKDNVLQILRDNLLWSTPSSLVTKIQELHPEATAKQIHSAWTVMSEELWKKDLKQLPSAKLLLEEYSEEVD
ncbi:hypothetical protein F5050DRAFT_1716568, partial [Lentinula boryana]